MLRRRQRASFFSNIRLRIYSNLGLTTLKNERGMRLLFHSLGFSSIGAALILQSQVLAGIFENGYFMGIEENLAVLSLEALLTVFAVVYFGYLFWRLVLSTI